jgi:hypothetical protein
MLFRLLRRWMNRPSRPDQCPGRSRPARPSLEALEDRQVMSAAWGPQVGPGTVPAILAAPLPSALTAHQVSTNQSGPGLQPKALFIGYGNLIINGTRMFETQENYLNTICWLTVKDENIWRLSDLIDAGNVAAIKKLEDPLRRQIFTAMNNHSTPIIFKDTLSAQENFTMRMEAIRFMRMIQKDEVDFGYYARYATKTHPPIESEVPSTWEKEAWGTKYPVDDFSTVFRSVDGVKADDALEDIITHRFRGECLGALEICIFYGADIAIGATAFNDLHKDGLHEVGLPEGDPGMSIYKNLSTSGGRYGVQDLIPGDFVYMKNDSRYRQYLKPGVTDYWNGENTLYMGKYRTDKNHNPVYTGQVLPRYSGMGLYDETEGQLRSAMAKAFHNDTGRNDVQWSDIYFAIHGTPKTGL